MSAGAIGADVDMVAAAVLRGVSRSLEASVSFEAGAEPLGAAVLTLPVEEPALPVSLALADPPPPTVAPPDAFGDLPLASWVVELALPPPPDADLLALAAATMGILGDFPSAPLLSYTQN